MIHGHNKWKDLFLYKPRYFSIDLNVPFSKQFKSYEVTQKFLHSKEKTNSSSERKYKQPSKEFKNDCTYENNWFLRLDRYVFSSIICHCINTRLSPWPCNDSLTYWKIDQLRDSLAQKQQQHRGIQQSYLSCISK